MYCKFCGNHLEDNSTICGRCGSDIDPNDGGQSFYDDEELNEWKESSGLPEMRTIMPTAEISQDDDFDDEIYEKMRKEPTTIMRSGKGSVSKSKRKASKKKSDIYIIAGLAVLIAAMIILLAAFVLIYKDKDSESNNAEEVTSEASENSISEEASMEKPENNDNDRNVIDIPTDKDIADICSTSDKTIYLFGEEVKLINKSEANLSVYSYDPENNDIIYIPFDRLMLAMGYDLADESTSASSIEVVFEKTEKTGGDKENCLKIEGNEVSQVSVKKHEYKVYIEFFDSEADSETKTMLYPVLNCDDEGKNIHETYVPAGEFVRALGLNYDEQGDTINIDEAKSDKRNH